MSERIAILGAGPMGLESALYARFLGYEVAVYERGSEVAANVASWSHVRLFTPFAMNATPLGVAAISAQQPGWQPPAATALLTGQEFRDAYLAPLAATDHRRMPRPGRLCADPR